MLRYRECLWPPQVTRPVLPRRNSACSQAVRGPHPKAPSLGDTAPCLLPSVRTLALRSLRRLLADPIPPSAAFPMCPASGCRSAAASRRSSVCLPKSGWMALIRYPNEAAVFSISFLLPRISGIHVWRRPVIYPLIAFCLMIHSFRLFLYLYCFVPADLRAVVGTRMDLMALLSNSHVVTKSLQRHFPCMLSQPHCRVDCQLCMMRFVGCEGPWIVLAGRAVCWVGCRAVRSFDCSSLR